ncbi:tripartite tricarboxylate transporter substrate binding protein [Verticiella sediminum]|uniref:Tripartite tricarboxylate transporter substrate binding protein n=1 Tax=Verticiella sediminum TaxID=1247510 RepID=A0A556AYW8_9BURK|nr:tripartite tricarboxylate transporter substrate binding protein [Verticiella sediminum]TSH98132.1 tripartite tricarboxylate transporter substrate binding protein [Verticiella sediminum]
MLNRPVRARRAYLRAVCTALAGAVLSAFASTAAADGYPEKPVSIVVGFAPGGTNDILARLVSAKLQERLKQSFVVENKPGASSAIGTGFVAKAKPDGYTLLVSSSGGLTVNPAVMKGLSYDPMQDFEPIALLGSFPLIVTVPAALPIANLKDLAQYATGTQDGRLDHGVASSSFQLAAETLSAASDIKFNHVSYRGSGPVVAALLGQEIQVGVLDSAAVMPQVQAGKLKALAVTTGKRSAAFPDIPTVAENGFADYDVTIWTGLMAPKGTPEPVLAALRTAVADILKEQDTVEKMHALGMDPGNTDSAALSERIAQDIARWDEVARAANLKPE